MELPGDEVTAVVVPGHQEPLTLTINKRKRTKRLSRISSDEEEEDRRSYDSVVTEEEQDMANCLILLARAEVVGGGKRKLADMGCCYECNTCNKTFPSFQALGGHRASHGKPKSESNDCEMEKQLSLSRSSHGNFLLSSSSNCSISLQLSTPKPITTTTTTNNNNNVATVKSSTLSKRSHQCSICGSEFSSGQALGGHMRRHRAVPIPVGSPCTGVSGPVSSMRSGGASSSEVGEVKTRSFLSLDLNLPAPEDGEIDHQRGVEDKQNAAFLQQKTLAFSAHAHALLGCPY